MWSRRRPHATVIAHNLRTGSYEAFSVSAVVAASLLLALRSAVAASRPRYGGTLRVELSAAPASLDPAQSSAFLTSTQQELAPLMFDCLVEVEPSGSAAARLAVTWEHDPDYRRWLFHLRSGVVLHMGRRCFRTWLSCRLPLRIQAGACACRGTT